MVARHAPTSNRKASNNQSHPYMVDSLDIQIIDELLSDANISTTEIASKYKVPVSTIQRRRAAIESLSMLKHEYNLNPVGFGLRPVEFWIMVEKGKADEVAHNIFEKYNNVLRVSTQMNSISNVGVAAYVKSSEQLYSMLEGIKSMPFVENVEFAETIKIIRTRQANFFRLMAGDNSMPASQQD
jgi:DNA-binding Lrp family transcriptional regulator